MTYEDITFTCTTIMIIVTAGMVRVDIKHHDNEEGHNLYTSIIIIRVIKHKYEMIKTHSMQKIN